MLIGMAPQLSIRHRDSHSKNFPDCHLRGLRLEIAPNLQKQSNCLSTFDSP
jgi:hypothetical protein